MRGVEKCVFYRSAVTFTCVCALRQRQKVFGDKISSSSMHIPTIGKRQNKERIERFPESCLR